VVDSAAAWRRRRLELRLAGGGEAVRCCTRRAIAAARMQLSTVWGPNCIHGPGSEPLMQKRTQPTFVTWQRPDGGAVGGPWRLCRDMDADEAPPRPGFRTARDVS